MREQEVPQPQPLDRPPPPARPARTLVILPPSTNRRPHRRAARTARRARPWMSSWWRRFHRWHRDGPGRGSAVRLPLNWSWAAPQTGFRTRSPTATGGHPVRRRGRTTPPICRPPRRTRRGGGSGARPPFAPRCGSGTTWFGRGAGPWPSPLRRSPPLRPQSPTRRLVSCVLGPAARLLRASSPRVPGDTVAACSWPASPAFGGRGAGDMRVRPLARVAP